MLHKSLDIQSVYKGQEHPGALLHVHGPSKVCIVPASLMSCSLSTDTTTVKENLAVLLYRRGEVKASLNLLNEVLHAQQTALGSS